ncbi:MAG TPA: hypothetical protein VE864_01830, partial [Streptosporangiaceae bacterium]|nr:hypothetical protein [Streptosporangiaceae bacterium]
MPTLQVTDRSRPPSANGTATAWMIRLASKVAVACRSRSPHSTTNSSPPSRATVSVRRARAVSRRAISTSTRSPVSWPKESLISLK